MILIIILIVIYLLSVYGTYKYTQIEFSYKGTMYGHKPTFINIYFTFMPIANTAYSFLWIFISPIHPSYRNSNKFKINYLKFYKVNTKGEQTT